jgi:outer membrane lipoprotein-sorting protein
VRKTLIGFVLLATLAAAVAGAGEKAAAGDEKKKPLPPPKKVKVKEVPVSAAELKKLLTDWGAAQKKLKTIVTDFKCEEENDLLAEPQVTGGKISIQKPDGYRREIYVEKKLKNGKTEKKLTGLMILKPPMLWIYLPKDKRAEEINIKKVAGKAGTNPLKRLGDIISFDEKRIAKSFTVKAVGLGKDLYRLTYTPKSGKAIGNVTGVRVWMKKGARFPRKMETSSAGGDVRTETYTNTKFDGKLDAALFKFKKPRGVKLVKVRK